MGPRPPGLTPRGFPSYTGGSLSTSSCVLLTLALALVAIPGRGEGRAGEGGGGGGGAATLERGRPGVWGGSPAPRGGGGGSRECFASATRGVVFFSGRRGAGGCRVRCSGGPSPGERARSSRARR